MVVRRIVLATGKSKTETSVSMCHIMRAPFDMERRLLVEKQMVKGSYWLGLLSSLIALGLRSLNAFGIMTPEVVKQGQTVWYMSFYQGSASVFSGRHCHGELRLGAWRKDLKGIPSHRHFGNRAPLAGRRQTVECRDIRISESEGMASPRCVRLECVKKKSEECLKKVGDGARATSRPRLASAPCILG